CARFPKWDGRYFDYW
nr:immunoglobulin heavy chain junction region [Mus musculus]MBK4188726.1 immunoglobulin heavy chain junction region [Mus musculus]MBK4188727.1 immunoglobulin heavy chain junction region [Mus musculus]MBK4188728.1 immunoglobulin heavy chain junction region [Mus musculus]MBK4188732.1 immunoglobulin heavy chain junction region [Mus musculus]